MTDIPIIMLVFVLGFMTVILTMGYIFRTKFPVSMLLFFCGAIFLFLFVTTDNIQALGLDTTEIPNYNLTYPMNVVTGATGVSLDNTFKALAEKPANINSLLYNTKISCINIQMLRVSNPTGNALIGILDNNNNVVKQFGSIDVSTLSTVTKDYKFCLSNHDYWIIALYDYVGVKYTNGDATNKINVIRHTSNTFDGTNSIRSLFSTSWSDTTTDDVRMILTSDDLTVSHEEELYPIRNNITFEPTFIGIAIMLMSLCLIIVGGLVETGKFN